MPACAFIANALVGGSRTFFKIFQELLFDQVGVSAGRLRRFTVDQGKSGRIGLLSRHGLAPTGRSRGNAVTSGARPYVARRRLRAGSVGQRGSRVARARVRGA